ncbi:MAG TPA: hypothetical protein VGG75_05690 [Trebonia sp.]|jgi:hypothetical protein
MMSDGPVSAVRVHLTGSDIPVGTAPAAPKGTRSVFQTITLTADDPAQPILPASDSRKGALVQALDADITVALSLANAAAGVGTVVPTANTAPYPVSHDAAVYAAAVLTGTDTARVAVTAVYEE